MANLSNSEQLKIAKSQNYKCKIEILELRLELQTTKSEKKENENEIKQLKNQMTSKIEELVEVKHAEMERRLFEKDKELQDATNAFKKHLEAKDAEINNLKSKLTKENKDEILILHETNKKPMRSEKVQYNFKKEEEDKINGDFNQEECYNPSKKTFHTNDDLRKLIPKKRNTITQPKDKNNDIDETPKTNNRKISNERDVGTEDRKRTKRKPVEEFHIKRKIKAEEYF